MSSSSDQKVESELTGRSYSRKVCWLMRVMIWGAKDLVVHALVGRKESRMQGIDLVEDRLPMLEVRLLLGGVDEGEFRRDAAGVVRISCAALGFAPRVFRVVDSAQAEVFGGRLLC